VPLAEPQEAFHFDFYEFERNMQPASDQLHVTFNKVRRGHEPQVLYLMPPPPGRWAAWTSWCACARRHRRVRNVVACTQRIPCTNTKAGRPAGRRHVPHYAVVPWLQAGVFNAVAMWFELHLDEETSLSTSPYLEKGPTWQQVREAGLHPNSPIFSV
jgi:hypothetical protein